MILTIDGHDFDVDSSSDLCAHIDTDTLRQARWSDVDLGFDEAEDPGEEGTFFGLMMLSHDARALLAYFRYAGDVGFVSRDPAYADSKDAMLDFRLSNGQVDDFPAFWTIPLDDALRALEYALVHRARAPCVTWNDDSLLDSWQEWQTMIASSGNDQDS